MHNLYLISKKFNKILFFLNGKMKNVYRTLWRTWFSDLIFFQYYSFFEKIEATVYMYMRDWKTLNFHKGLMTEKYGIFIKVGWLKSMEFFKGRMVWCKTRTEKLSPVLFKSIEILFSFSWHFFNHEHSNSRFITFLCVWNFVPIHNIFFYTYEIMYGLY